MMKIFKKNQASAIIKHMNSHKRGFTIVEVILVLALGSLMMIGALSVITSKVVRERYDDAVESFASFLSESFNEVENVQITRSGSTSNRIYCTLAGQYNYNIINSQIGYTGNNIIEDLSQPGFSARRSSPGASKWLGSSGRTNYWALGYPGRTECAVYGKLVVFGENSGNGEKVYSYDVIGTTNSYTNGSFNEIIGGNNDDGSIMDVNTTNNAAYRYNNIMANVFADVVVLDKRGGTCGLRLAGDNPDAYLTVWDSKIKDTNGNDFKGSLLIVRSPHSATIRTYFSEKALQVQDLIAESATYSCNVPSASVANSGLYGMLTSTVSDMKFNDRTVTFCVDSEDVPALNGRRKGVRIVQSSSSSEGVEVIDQDTGDNPCI